MQDPEDIYSYHINIVKAKFDELVGTDAKYYFLSNFNVNRKFIKKIIMTIPYSVTLYGITNQIISKANKTNKSYTKITYRILDINNNYIELTLSQIRLKSKILNENKLFYLW